MPTVDESMAGYASAVSAREQAESAVISASQALRDASAQVEQCKINEECALFNLGIAVGIPSEKLIVSAQAKVTLDSKKSALPPE